MLLRRIARPLFATWFVSEGLDALRHPASHVAAARATLTRFGSAVPGSTAQLTDTQLTTAVRAHGGTVVLAATMLALGRAPRTAALALAGLTAPLVLVNLPERGRPVSPAEKAERRERLVRALAFTAGAVLVGADYEGRPGLRWRLADAHERRVAAHGSDDT